MKFVSRSFAEMTTLLLVMINQRSKECPDTLDNQCLIWEIGNRLLNISVGEKLGSYRDNSFTRAEIDVKCK